MPLLWIPIGIAIQELPEAWLSWEWGSCGPGLPRKCSFPRGGAPLGTGLAKEGLT